MAGEHNAVATKESFLLENLSSIFYISRMNEPAGHPRRPPRLVLYRGMRPFYFLTFNTAHRARILDNEPLHAAFLSFCLRAEAEHGIAVGRYVLMPDHIHLFVFLPEGRAILTRWVASLKTVLGKSLLAQGRNKPHWQPGFFDHLLRSSESTSQKWEYVRNNPVRAGLCDHPDQWPWQGEIIRLEF